ncbi:alpha-d-galacturonidase [Pinibacter soli]|uniref:Beta-hexosaminidase bacterial type N-terminal domain-containing protein n=1 Tax=Pinibacter soli TaxID=3044211 RepID=A0ABT6RFB3_9BACT|nr:hypothetical protein [Pinibacter soli]MDI3321166.1 hypothetical protein [Pinibacter soli]
MLPVLKNRTSLYLLIIVLATMNLFAVAQNKKTDKTANLLISLNASKRVQFGADKVSAALQQSGYGVKTLVAGKSSAKVVNIVIGKLDDDICKNEIAQNRIALAKQPGKEGFVIKQLAVNKILVAGADESGVLYGLLALADSIRKYDKIPADLNVTDQPEMVLRGACVGLQKPAYLPGRNVYEYPYTEETFPWFYDKKLWLQYLDSLVSYRLNSLYLWNGHPFASLVKLKEYPYAVEVDDATFKKNEEMFTFLTEEADKRGIWVIQSFYNIIVSKPFAEKNNLKTQDRNRPIIPIIADYTRKSIAAFVEKYPNVGLLVTLGEAMEGVGQDDIDWFTKTIIPGVQDGLKALGSNTQPPIVLRAHDSDAPSVMKYALPLYKNLYTMAKYNGEALTTYTPRGSWAELHRTLSRIGTVHIENVHIMANLEPFRYGSADFIQKCVQAMHNVYEANGLHLYPEASYWDWPYTADKTSPRLLQVERDWIWYKTWSRYAWNCHRDRSGEINYWGCELGDKYGCDLSQGKNILEAYEQAGEIAPKLLRRYGITDGNRQTLTLGMLMTQLINPNRYGLFTLLYTSESPDGEMLIEYADKEWKHQPHVGETPVQIANEVVEHGRKAREAIDKAATSVTKNRAEFDRLKNDVYCYDALARSYSEKAIAALSVLRYKYSKDIADLETALVHLKKSVDAYEELTDLTNGTYLYANSMQTSQRKIPIRGVDGTFKTWKECLPVYQQEYNYLKKNIDSLKTASHAVKIKTQPVVLKNVSVKLLSKADGEYVVGSGASVFGDTASSITAFAAEIRDLKGIRFSRTEQRKSGTEVTFKSDKPVKVVVGFFKVKDKANYLAPSDLETDATANDLGQADIKLANALTIAGFPLVNIHTFSFPAGTNTLKLAKGACLVLGFLDGSTDVPRYNAGVGITGENEDVDWLFER